MTCQALERFEDEHEFKFKKITSIALEGDGAIERKVTRYVNLITLQCTRPSGFF